MKAASSPASSASAVRRSLAPRVDKRPPRWLRNSAGEVLAPGQARRTSSQPARVSRSSAWRGCGAQKSARVILPAKRHHDRAMLEYLRFLLSALHAAARTHNALVAENLLLRH